MNLQKTDLNFLTTSSQEVNVKEAKKKKLKRATSATAIKTSKTSGILDLQLRKSPPLHFKSKKVNEKDKKPSTNSVENIFAKSYPDNSNYEKTIDGQSLPPHLPSSRFLKNEKTRKTSESTIHFPSIHSKAPRSALTIEKLLEMPLAISRFADLLDEKLKEPDLENTFTHDKELTRFDLEQIFGEKMKILWNELLQEVDPYFPDFEDEKTDELIEINFLNIGIEELLNLNPEKSLKTTLTNKNSFKGNKHLKIAFEFLHDFFLDFSLPTPFEQKTNRQKMEQFHPNAKSHSSSITLAFNYIQSLLMLAEILKHYEGKVDHKNKDKDHIFEIAKKFAKEIRNLSELDKLHQHEKKTIREKCHVDCANCITIYAKYLVKQLTNAVKLEENPSITKYFHDSLTQSIPETITTNGSDSFEGDIGRPILGNFLSLTSDKKKIEPPLFTQDMQERMKEEYVQTYSQLLTFFIQNLGIQDFDHETSLPFDPMTRLKETKSIENVYQEFESKWRHDHILKVYRSCQIDSEDLKDWEDEPLKIMKEKGSIPKSSYKAFIERFKNEIKEKKLTPQMDGIFKLLIVLRAFSQSVLCGPQYAMIFVEREMTGTSHKIIREFPTAPTIEECLEGEKLDKETKQIAFSFENDKLTVKFWRRGALEKLPLVLDSPRLDHKQELYNHCLVDSTVTLSASIHDLTNWSLEIFTEIERPITENDPAFLERYSSLIATLELMGMKYTVKEA